VVAPAVASQTLLAMQDAETGAKVTSVEFYQSASVSAPSAAPVTAPSTVISAQTTQAAVASAVSVLGQQAKAPLAAGSASAPSEAPADAPVSALELATPVEAQASGAEQTEISEAAHEGAPRDEAQQQQDHGAEAQTSDGQSSGAGQQAETAPRQVAFQPSEVQGMRGLDAIVASLLRTGAGDDKSAAGAARTDARLSNLEVGKVQTAKSETTKDAEKSQLESESLKQSALLREEERSNVREALQHEPQHAFMAELRHEPLAMLDAAPEVLPLPAPVLVQDPDAAAMGKIARGEGVNAAAISIDHPEFGAMDVVVHNENGRIDVRATLETPKAAAVMRAHESALRYGIQQAGMTFGALRVRSRGQEPTQLKQRDSVKRRRSEWEA
jgi:hypothetical protein